MTTHYRASKTRSDRPGWSVTFRHPARSDSRGQRGLKVRRGLGTDDASKADQLIAELNELLEDQSWWTGDRRGEAEGKFSPVVVSAFFDGIEAGGLSSDELRNEFIPLPTRDDGYSHILFLGTTGAGKTTLVRHVIGSDPIEDRFPSTSTAKTTTADIEIVTAPGLFRAVATFMPEHEARAHIEECVEEACLEAVQRQPDTKIMGAFLQHREQRFRLSYVLGSWTSAVDDDEADFRFDDADDDESVSDEESVGSEERSKNLEQLGAYLLAIKNIAADVERTIRGDLGPLQMQKSADDRAAWLEIFGNEVFRTNAFSELVLDTLEDVGKRFELLPGGDINRRTGDWPTMWSLEESDRQKFLAHVRWFSSNHHKQFGRLLTPLVNGIRVKGPLSPSLAELAGADKLVLLDGEGLGHTATTVSSISTRVTQRFSAVDMILLVDNAQQPMQAAPLALLRAAGSAGFANKLAVAFTHFDQVKGANLGSFEHRREHVAASVGNAIASLKDIVGAGVAGAIERQIERQSYFLGGLNRQASRLPTGFRDQLRRLLDAMQAASKPREPIECAPIYEFKGLEIAMRDGIEAFRNPWKARLGLGYHDGIPKEHWTRIKALSRRITNGWNNKEYDNLRPVADLLACLQEEVSKWLERPADWSRLPRDDDEREAALDGIRRSVFARLHELTERRLTDDQVARWRTAYDFSGTGSGVKRARTIDNIHDHAAPHIDAAMTQEARDFLTELYSILAEAIELAGGTFRPIAA